MILSDLEWLSEASSGLSARGVNASLQEGGNLGKGGNCIPQGIKKFFFTEWSNEPHISRKSVTHSPTHNLQWPNHCQTVKQTCEWCDSGTMTSLHSATSCRRLLTRLQIFESLLTLFWHFLWQQHQTSECSQLLIAWRTISEIPVAMSDSVTCYLVRMRTTSMCGTWWITLRD